MDQVLVTLAPVVLVMTLALAMVVVILVVAGLVVTGNMLGKCIPGKFRLLK